MAQEMRGTVTEGTIHEYKTISKLLLEKKFQIYVPVVDLGIDCIVDVGKGNYKAIQIKSKRYDSSNVVRFDVNRSLFEFNISSSSAGQ